MMCMSNVYTYERIVKQAKYVKAAVEKEYKIAGSRKWAYYFAQAILHPNKDVKKIEFELPKKFDGDYISRGIYKSSYKDMAERVVKFIEGNHQMPAYVKHTVKSGKVFNIECDMYVYMFAKILAEDFPQPVNLTSKAFIKPTETENVVYDYVTKKTGKRFTTLDELLAYVQKHGRYIFEFDDVRSNKQVTDCFCGNCTDWLQWLWNMAKAMGYECRAIHVKCRVSGTGHVRGQFKHPKNTGGQWIDRDPAAVANGESITSIWCSDGYVLATNPSWFMANLNR